MFPPPPPKIWEIPLGQQIVLLKLYAQSHRAELANLVLAKLGDEKPTSADWSAQIRANHVTTFGGWKLTPSGDRAAKDLMVHYGRQFNIHHIFYKYDHRGNKRSVHCACGAMSCTPRPGHHCESTMGSAVAHHERMISRRDLQS
jgi:hypothetical protein